MPHARNEGMELDLSLLNRNINLSCLIRRAASHMARRTVKVRGHISALAVQESTSGGDTWESQEGKGRDRECGTEMEHASRAREDMMKLVDADARNKKKGKI